MHLIGGYLDEHCRSEELSLHLLQHFIKDASTKYLLQTACIGSLNTTYRDKGTAYPVVYGCGVEVASGEIWPATFPDSEPEELVRHIRYTILTNADLLNDI